MEYPIYMWIILSGPQATNNLFQCLSTSRSKVEVRNVAEEENLKYVCVLDCIVTCAYSNKQIIPTKIIENS